MQPAPTSVAVGLFGVGLIGKALLSQINAQVRYVRLVFYLL
jgi:homoserine dehydrogenase